MKAKVALLCILVSFLIGCSDKSIKEKHLEVSGISFHEALSAVDYTINGIVFCLNVGIEFAEEGDPFCVRLEAVKQYETNQMVTLRKVKVTSTEKKQYQLVDEASLPLQLKFERMGGESPSMKSVCFYQFQGRLNPDFDKNEVLTVAILVEVGGQTKELVYDLSPFVNIVETR